MTHMRLLAFASYLAFSSFALTACSTPPAEQAVSVTPETWQTYSQRNVLNGETPLAYQAAWNVLRLDPELGAQSATISATSYVLECDCDRSLRPVMFLFNGGPGASSSPLHFAVGPYARMRGDQGQAEFPANAHTILPYTDLIFIDPVDTGFSRAPSEQAVNAYLGVEGDVDAVNQIIVEWLKQNDRVGTPVFLAGQSYGGFRLGNLLDQIENINVRGLIMVSPMLEAGAGGTDLAYVFSLPTMVATSWRYGKSSVEAQTEAEAWQAGKRYAESDYLMALQQGARLDPLRRDKVANEIAAMTGLTVEQVLEYDLRIDIQFYLETVLGKEGLLVSRLNTDVTTPRPPSGENPHRPAAANDPSLGLGRSNVILSEDIAAYLEAQTGAVLGADYRSLNLDANFQWDWRQKQKGPAFYVNAAKPLAKYMNAHLNVRLLVFGGYRDLATTLLGHEYTLAHHNLPQDRIELIHMPGGHSPYDEADLKEEFSGRIRAFMERGAVSGAPNMEDPVQ